MDLFIEHHRAGRAAWPGVDLDAGVFDRHLAALAHDGEPPPERAAGDLYLACACASGVPAALDAFEAAFGGMLKRAVARVDSSDAFVSDAMQAVREHLLVGESDAPPRIASYSGRSTLGTWLKIVAVRRAINLRRRKGDAPHEPLSAAAAALAHTMTPELGILRARYKEPFEGALRAAVRRLAARDRDLLRLHLVERTSIDGVAATYRVSRATAARWAAAARESLLKETRRLFREQTGVNDSEFLSIVRALQSDLDVSIASQLTP